MFREGIPIVLFGENGGQAPILSQTISFLNIIMLGAANPPLRKFRATREIYAPAGASRLPAGP